MYKRFDVMCINVFNVMYKLRLVGLNIYFYDVFFSYKMGSKWVQKGTYRNEVLFFFWDHIKVQPNGHLLVAYKHKLTTMN